MSQDERPGLDSLIAALAERLLSGVFTTASTTRLAVAETRLAASSLVLILGIVVVLAVAVVVTWVLFIALFGYGLAAVGVPVGWALFGVLALHVAGCVALLAVLKKLVRHLRFEQTRQALKRRESSDVPKLHGDLHADANTAPLKK